MTRFTKTVVFLLAFACLWAAAPDLSAGVLMVPASAFDVRDPGTKNGWYRDYRIYVMSFNAEMASAEYFDAAVNLPQGVSPKKITLYCYDNGSGIADYITLWFYRYKPSTDTVEMLGSVGTTGASASTAHQVLPVLITKKAVDNKNYSYYLEVKFPYNCSWQVEFRGAKIEW